MAKKKKANSLSAIKEKLNSGEELVKVNDYINKKQNLVDFANAVQNIHAKLYEKINIYDTVEEQLSIELERNLERFVSTLQLSQSEILENHIKSKVSVLAKESMDTHLESMGKLSYRIKALCKRLFYKKEMYLSVDDLLKSKQVRKCLVDNFIADGKLKGRNKVIQMTRGKINSNLGRLFDIAVANVQGEYPSKTFKDIIDSYSAKLAVDFTDSITIVLPMEFVSQDGESIEEDVKLYVDLVSDKLLSVIKLEAKAKRIMTNARFALSQDHGYRPLTGDYAAVNKGVVKGLDDMVAEIISFTQEYGNIKKEMAL